MGRVVPVLVTVITFILYVINVVISSLSRTVLKDLGWFVSTVGNQSRSYGVEVTPVPWMFGIWTIIYIWNALWLIYALINLCRRVKDGRASDSPTLLPVTLFLSFSVNVIASIAWSFLFDRGQIEGAFIGLFFMAFSLYICLYISYRRLHENGAYLRKMGRGYDVWLVRILVQNGISIYATWCSIATLINLAVVMIYSPQDGMSNENASTVTLSLLLVELTAYSIADFVFFDRYLRYIVVPYLVIPVTLGAVIARDWEDRARNYLFTCVLLGLSLAVCLSKFVLLVWRHFRNSPDTGSLSDSTEDIKKESSSELHGIRNEIA